MSLDLIREFLTTGSGAVILRSLVILLLGLILARAGGALVGNVMARRMSAQGLFLLRRVVVYGIWILTAISIMRELGFKLHALLGAAGVLTVAIGFASQTSASNLISGLFLVAEQPFRIGDTIRIGDLTGEVLTIDLLSVKLRTPDNLFVRVPNESIIKSNVTTITRFPIRRHDLKLRVSFQEDLPMVRDCLMRVAAENPGCLAEPLPLFIVQGFGDSGVDIQFSTWARREGFFEFRNSIAGDVLAAFRKDGIEVALPQLRLSDDVAADVDAIKA